ncbi:MAG: ATP-dependent DNA helicase RecG [Bacteroidetes bacterium]|nr:ATP-dependent DNA helicase RecG [Bacteroidota bacterium]
MLLSVSLQSFQAIPPKRIALLKKECGIETVGDLLQYYPFRYVDRTKFYQIREISEELPYIQLIGKIDQIRLQGVKHKQRLTARLSDTSGSIELVWFQGIKYIQQNIQNGIEYVVFGKPTLFQQNWNIAHPELEIYSAEKAKLAPRLQPVYPGTEALKRARFDSKAFSVLISQVINKCRGKIEESLPDSVRQMLNLIALEDAFRLIHAPSNPEELQKAELRLKFEELFFLQLRLLQLNQINRTSIKGFSFGKIGNYFNDFYKNHLPFELTGAQKKVLKQIRSDVARPIQMNRLIQGDVGSGKTIVAFMSMLMAIDNGYQACLMAPTEILAQQHYSGLKDLASAVGLNIGLLTGSVKKKDRRPIHAQLQSGEMHILVGTHALLEDEVQFDNLGLVVIDEQHRFGVAQRARLWAKNTLPPHVLIMSATPIPRTLAMTLYGDLDISVIDELPPGRKPIQTTHVYEQDRHRVLAFIRDQINLGRQIYVVYPLIEESEQMDYKNLMDGFNHLTDYFPSPKYQLSIVHGKLPAADKEFEMHRFVKHQTNIMVATTVIEVGVNVPNASVMIIESAERFGLSQLHQLRGRVGRGADQSYCILMTGFKLSKEARTRLETMVETNDGFKIAEVDLMLRGPGDLQGTQQSGNLDLKIADISKDNKLLIYCRELAVKVLETDPELILDIHAPMRKKLDSLKQKYQNWGRIS